MDSNQSRAVGGTIWVHFRVHWPIWGPLDGSKARFRPFRGRFWPRLTPPANLVNSNGPKWLVQVSITKRKIIINHHLGCFDDDDDYDDSIIILPDSLKLPSLGCFGDLRDTEDDLSPEKERSFTIVLFYFIFLFIKIWKENILRCQNLILLPGNIYS